MTLPAGSKVSIFYEYKGKGFSETLYSTSAGDSVKSEIRNYLGKRLAFADDQMIATYARISDMQAARRVAFMDLKDEAGMQGKVAENGCSPTDVILVRMNNVVYNASHFFVHAFPAKFIKEDVVVPAGSWFDNLAEWANYLTSQSVTWRMLISNAVTIADRKPISGGAPRKPRGWTVTCPDVPALVAGNVVMIGGTSQDGVGYRGKKVVQSVNATDKSFVVGGASPVGDLGANAYYVKRDYSLSRVSAVQAVRLTERKVGRPFALPVGRRTATLSLRR